MLSGCAKVRYCRMRVRWAFQVVLISICVKGVVLDQNELNPTFNTRCVSNKQVTQ